MLEPGESAAVRGAGSAGAASGRSPSEHPHRVPLQNRRPARRPGRTAPAPQICLLGTAERPAARNGRPCRALASR